MRSLVKTIHALSALAAVLVIAGCSPPLAAPTATPTVAPAHPQGQECPGCSAAPSPVAAASPSAAASPAASPAAVAPASSSSAPNEHYEAAKREASLVIYASGDAASWEPLKAGFTQRYPGINLEVVIQRGRDSREKVIAEQGARRVVADIVSAGPDSTTELDQLGFLDAYKSPELAGVVPEFVDPRGVLVPRNINIYGITVNTRLIPAGQEPKRWTDLTDPKYKGKLAMQDPRGSGGGLTVLTALQKVYGDEFMEKLAAQNIFIGNNTADIRTALIRGEYAVLLTDTAENVAVAVTQGNPLKFIRPEDGIAVTPISATIVKNGPHPNAARLFVDWILSDEGQRAVASTGSTPVRRGVPVRSPEYGLDGAVILPRDDQETDPARNVELTKLWERLFFKPA